MDCSETDAQAISPQQFHLFGPRAQIKILLVGYSGASKYMLGPSFGYSNRNTAARFT